MAREVNRLTARQVATLNPPPGKSARFADGNRLYLAVGKDGQRRWVYLYWWRKRLVEMGLGSVKDVSLKDARDKARIANGQLASGISPLEAKRRAPEAVPTFGDFADGWLKTIEGDFKNPKHADFYKRVLNTYLADLRPKLVSDVGTEDIMAILQPMWTTGPGGKMETASRSRGILERVLDAAKVKSHRTGENPARWKNHLKHLLPARRKLTKGHFAAVPYVEMPTVMTGLRAVEGVAARALEFLTLTGVRSGDIRGMVWAEVDFAKAVWVIPQARLKNSPTDHLVPLVPRAVEILKDIQALRWNDTAQAHVFPGQKVDTGLSDAAMRDVLQDNLGRAETVHGIRSALKDWATNETDFDFHTSEEVLNHAVGNEVQKAYRRGHAEKKRRALLEAWADYLAGKPSNVIEHDFAVSA